MLREDYIINAAAVHNCGTRFLRDAAAAMLPCFTLSCSGDAFTAAKFINRGESFMSQSIALCEGLIESSGLSKYTAVCEARMRLMSAELDGSLTARQVAAERKQSVKPGTRGDVYNGYVELSAQAGAAAAECADFMDKCISSVKEGRICFALPVIALTFLKRLVSDYSIACNKLAAGESAMIIKRGDMFEKMRMCLSSTASCCGAELPQDATADALAAMASSGLIVSTPPVLFDLLLRYENLPSAANEI